MAHFAQLDENNIVTRVIVVGDEYTSDAYGNEIEEIGINFCKGLFGDDTNWKQTSYNNKIRFRYAGIGYKYDEELDAFIAPKPYPSWTFDAQTADWISPLGNKPTLTEKEIASGKVYIWDEELYQMDNKQGWVTGFPFGSAEEDWA